MFQPRLVHRLTYNGEVVTNVLGDIEIFSQEPPCYSCIKMPPAFLSLKVAPTLAKAKGDSRWQRKNNSGTAITKLIAADPATKLLSIHLEPTPATGKLHIVSIVEVEVLSESTAYTALHNNSGTYVGPAPHTPNTLVSRARHYLSRQLSLGSRSPDLHKMTAHIDWDPRRAIKSIGHQTEHIHVDHRAHAVRRQLSESGHCNVPRLATPQAVRRQLSESGRHCNVPRRASVPHESPSDATNFEGCRVASW